MALKLGWRAVTRTFMYVKSRRTQCMKPTILGRGMRLYLEPHIIAGNKLNLFSCNTLIHLHTGLVNPGYSPHPDVVLYSHVVRRISHISSYSLNISAYAFPVTNTHC